MITRTDLVFEGENEDCPWCCRDPHDEDGACAEMSTNGMRCTLPPNHTGPHVACGLTNHAIEVWED